MTSVVCVKLVDVVLRYHQDWGSNSVIMSFSLTPFPHDSGGMTKHRTHKLSITNINKLYLLEYNQLALHFPFYVDVANWPAPAHLEISLANLASYLMIANLVAVDYSILSEK